MENEKTIEPQIIDDVKAFDDAFIPLNDADSRFIAAKIPIELNRKLCFKAIKDDVTKSKVIRDALEEYLKGVEL